jgi:hypothetical protein
MEVDFYYRILKFFVLDPKIFLDEYFDYVLFMRREKFQDDAWGSA